MGWVYLPVSLRVCNRHIGVLWAYQITCHLIGSAACSDRRPWVTGGFASQRRMWCRKQLCLKTSTFLKLQMKPDDLSFDIYFYLLIHGLYFAPLCSAVSCNSYHIKQQAFQPIAYQFIECIMNWSKHEATAHIFHPWDIMYIHVT